MHSRAEADVALGSQVGYELFVNLFSVFAGVMIMTAPLDRECCMVGIGICALVMSLYGFAILTGEDRESTRRNLFICCIWLLNLSLQGFNLYLLGSCR